MTLGDLVAASGLIDIRCMQCHCRTSVDPAFFLARRGNISLSELSKHTVCAGCGSGDVTLVPIDAANAKP